MKSKEQQLLEEAYSLITNTVQPNLTEEGLKGAAAAALMGLGTLAGAQGADSKHMTPDDYADKAAIEHASAEADELSVPAAYDKVVELVNSSSKEIPDELLEIISKDGVVTKRLAHFLALKGFDTPDILKKHVGDYSKDLKQSFKGG